MTSSGPSSSDFQDGERRRPLRVVVFTCADLGIPTADDLAADPALELAAVFSAPHRRLPVLRRLRKGLRERGPFGLAVLLIARIGRRGSKAQPSRTPVHGIPVRRVADLHAADTVAQVAELEADVGVVDGTYILKETLFSVPRFGCINIHCGKVPEYRGSPPAFWELYNGTPEVGVTIHRVSAKLDAGAVLATAVHPIDLTPSGDPLRYAHDYWRDVLHPSAIALLRQCLPEFARGEVAGTPQPQSDVKPNRTPSWREVRELRRRVRERRRRSSGIS